MPAYIKLPDIDGEVNEQEHQNWIAVDCASLSIFRAISEGATGGNREKGETSLGDFVVVKQWDASTPLIAQAAAEGKCLREVKIHMCSTINNKNAVNLEVKLKNVVITAWNFSGNSEQQPMPTEQLTLNYTKIDFIYKKFNEDGSVAGNFPASYDTQAS